MFQPTTCTCTGTHSRQRGLALLAGLWLLAASAVACDGCNPPPEPTPDAATCPPGTLGCPCNAGQCGDGLECQDGACRTVVQQAGLVVSSPDARACEVLLDHASDVQAVFATSLKGKAIAEGERLALAFTASADAAIAVGEVKLDQKPGATGSLSRVSVVTSRCFDRDGALLAGASVSLNLGQ